MFVRTQSQSGSPRTALTQYIATPTCCCHHGHRSHSMDPAGVPRSKTTPKRVASRRPACSNQCCMKVAAAQHLVAAAIAPLRLLLFAGFTYRRVHPVGRTSRYRPAEHTSAARDGRRRRNCRERRPRRVREERVTPLNGGENGVHVYTSWALRRWRRETLDGFLPWGGSQIDSCNL